MQAHSNAQSLDEFLTYIFAGEYEQAMQLCNADVEFVLFRPDVSNQVSIYGTHTGKSAGIELFKNLAELFTFGDFEVEDSVVTDDYIVRFGRLAHTVTQTGKVFNSLWAMIVRFDEAGKIVLYRMHEDTAALEAAMR